MANSKRKCKYCKEYHFVEGGILCNSGFFCCTEHAAKWAIERSEKKKKAAWRKEKQAHSKAKREFNRKDLKWQHKRTQQVFNKMRKLEELLWFKERGLEPVCISCGKPIGNDEWCAGHFKTVGAQSSLRYDQKNVYLQHNRRCNMGLSGDIAGTKTTMGYRQGLLERFGEEEGQKIIDYCESNTKPHKWTCEEVESIRFDALKRIKELEKMIDI